jgi:hypothetical protein
MSEPFEELTRERTFRDLWRLLQLWPSKAIDRWVLGFAFVGVALGAFLSGASGTDIGRAVRDTSATGFGLAGSILGIVIAGFAILTALTASPTVKLLATIPRRNGAHPGRDSNELKLIALHFVEAFVPYIIFLALHVVMMVVGWYGGPVTRVCTWIHAHAGLDAGRYGGAFMLGFEAAALLFLLVALRDLVFNVYKTFLHIAWVNLMLEDDKELKAATPSELLALSREIEANASSVAKPVLRVSGPAAVDDAEDDETGDGGAGLPGRRAGR